MDQLSAEHLIQNRRLENLVENQTSYALEQAEMHVFETHQQARSVLLRFDQPVLASMLQGKKVMHLNQMQSFDFLPGESLILPPSELMRIDFPEAEMENPTRCLAMTISEQTIRNTVLFLNENMPKCDAEEWRFTDYNFHFTNDIAIHQIIQRLLFLFAEGHPSKDIFANYMLKELIIRILQTENQKIYSEKGIQMAGNGRMTYIIKYIRANLDKSLSIDKLSNMIYMSPSNFHRVFKNETGVSPVDFINNERIKLAAGLLHDGRMRIKDVYAQCGFNNLSYFSRLFKRKYQLTPKAYQQMIQKG